MGTLSQMRSTDSRAYLFLTLTALFLAGNHVIGRSVHGEIPPVGLSFWRWAAGLLLLLTLVRPRFRQVLPLYRSYSRSFTVLGVTMIGSTTLVLIALNLTSAVNVSLLNAIQPTLTVLFACVFLKDRLTVRAVWGVAAGMAGVILMVCRADWSVLAGLQFSSGDFLALVAMCGFSAYAINLRKLPKELTTIESLLGIVAYGTVLLLPFYLMESLFYRTVPFTLKTVIVTMTLALLVSVAGNILWNRGNQSIGPKRASVFMNLIPVFGALLATLFLNEQIFPYHVSGALLICLAIFLVSDEMAAAPRSSAGQPPRDA